MTSEEHLSEPLSKETKDFIEAILCLKSSSEVWKFLRDVLTEQEIVEFGKRLKVARMLNEQVPYTTIEAETGLSSTTIARVSKWLNDGEGGYRLVLDRVFSKSPAFSKSNARGATHHRHSHKEHRS